MFHKVRESDAHSPFCSYVGDLATTAVKTNSRRQNGGCAPNTASFLLMPNEWRRPSRLSSRDRLPIGSNSLNPPYVPYENGTISPNSRISRAITGVRKTALFRGQTQLKIYSTSKNIVTFDEQYLNVKVIAI